MSFFSALRLLSCLGTLIVVVGFGAAFAADIEPAAKFDKYIHRMRVYNRDLLETGRGLTGIDKAINEELIGLTNEYEARLSHMYDLLVIESSMDNASDRRKVRELIGERFAKNR